MLFCLLAWIRSEIKNFHIYWFYCVRIQHWLNMTKLHQSCDQDFTKILNRVKPWLQLRFYYDTTTIRLRRIARAARLLPFDEIRREQKNESIFRRSHVVAVSQSNRNYDIGLRWITCTSPCCKFPVLYVCQKLWKSVNTVHTSKLRAKSKWAPFCDIVCISLQTVGLCYCYDGRFGDLFTNSTYWNKSRN